MLIRAVRMVAPCGWPGATVKAMGNSESAGAMVGLLSLTTSSLGVRRQDSCGITLRNVAASTRIVSGRITLN
jgi:hypothetical protein